MKKIKKFIHVIHFLIKFILTVCVIFVVNAVSQTQNETPVLIGCVLVCFLFYDFVLKPKINRKLFAVADVPLGDEQQQDDNQR